ncbi:hypothetical protein AMAG_04071 [Allomyces macrogynus ATCC 38327]|uniref:S1/P1 nuclease n=1 Tax=Allomyces macrogynus (strain ATCC 38327) TaxID=578462 RepID=A0A0L0S7V4_ALLM3|nr:hypothetical protein AMAG_04071 [Allomyces macrogynus ATCC 38327]|eukprot:KNE58501.1 hypothetical protein AMAG_04071 [Allomyces macrogynus ATCC 38327]
MRQPAAPLLAAVALATALLLVTAAPEVAAWGHTGHSLTGRVAMQLVQPSTRRALQQLLPEVNGDIARISSWADEVKRTSRFSDTGPLHYSDAHDDPPHACSYMMARDCPDGNCITVAIQEFSWAVRNATLAKPTPAPPAPELPEFASLDKRTVDDEYVDIDELLPLHTMEWVDAQRRRRRPNRPPRRQPKQPKRGKNKPKPKQPTPTPPPRHDDKPDKSLPLGQRYTVVESLKFLVHLVQDIHQPLHLSGRDRGGNDMRVTYNHHASNLHSVWDSLMLDKHMREEHGGSEPALAEAVLLQLATEWKADVSTWTQCPLAMPGAGKETTRAFAEQVDSTRADGAYMVTTAAPEAADDPAAMAVVLCPEHWATQSDQLNCATVWQNLEGDLAGAYHDANIPVARKAVAMGAVRLAALLDVVLTGMAA